MGPRGSDMRADYGEMIVDGRGGLRADGKAQESGDRAMRSLK